jgi:Rrf2 family protein
MKLSKKGEYALRAIIDLGIADLVGRDLVRVSEIAEKEKMSVKFLEQVMLQLREAGFVESERGKFGGYRLGKPASKITMGAIIRLIDGPLAPIGCVSQTSYVPCNCPDEAHCGLRMVMLDVRNAIAGIVDHYALSDIVEITTRKMRRDGVKLPFSETPQNKKQSSSQNKSRSDGILDELLGEYTI